MSRAKKTESTKKRLAKWVVEIAALAVARRVIRNLISKL